MLGARTGPTPDISVVIPTLNRPGELALCLDGFARQTAPRSRYEVIIVDDGSSPELAGENAAVVRTFSEKMNVVFKRSAHVGLAAARNIAIELSQAPLLLLYEDDQRPTTEAIEYSLAFHAHYPLERDATLLYFILDPLIAESPLMKWAFDHLYQFPESDGFLNWLYFWGGTVSCKRSLFRHGLFDPSYRAAEDAEFACRISQNVDLRVHFVRQSRGTLIRGVTFDQIYRRQYMMGYFRYRLQRDYHRVSFDYPPYDEPERYVIQSGARLSALLAIACDTAHIPDPQSSGFQSLLKVWNMLECHSLAQGWIAARNGLPPQAPAPVETLPAKRKQEEPRVLLGEQS